MKLLLDIGNTRLKWGLADGARLTRSGATEHHGDPAAALTQLGIDGPDAVWVAHVTGPDHELALSTALQQRFGTAPRYARTSAHWMGLHNAYTEPHRLGVDRWLAMAALWAESPSAFCVVDAGTALTVDCVDGSGTHLGGVIAAGLETQQRAVLGRTRFPVRSWKNEYGQGLGRDTEACVRQGAMLACLGAIDRAARVAGVQARRVITGGDASTLRSHLEGSWELRPDLVLEGLLHLAGTG
ncbi:MAG: type III pantothenate kinase [Nevskiales bacterium]|nr:type III pantothenate kinase [Nevskiales bacterium]